MGDLKLLEFIFPGPGYGDLVGISNETVVDFLAGFLSQISSSAYYLFFVACFSHVDNADFDHLFFKIYKQCEY